MKGQETDQDKTNAAFLDEWIKSVNEQGGFGKWTWAVSRQPGDLIEILRPYTQSVVLGIGPATSK